MSYDLVSVIVPAYNAEKYIERCIISIINQTYENLEILIINDGSTDNTPMICNKFKLLDSRISVFTQNNHGIAYSRNVGLSLSKGKYVFWIDSDDYIDCNIIMKLYNVLRENNADMAICDYIAGNENNYHFENEIQGNKFCMDSKQGLQHIYLNNHWSFLMTASWPKLIKRELYNGINYPNGKLFEDIAVSHKIIAKCNRIAYLDEVLYYYFQHSTSILGDKFYKEKMDYLEFFEERIIFFKELSYYDIEKMARIQFLHSLIWEYSRSKDILHDNQMTKYIKNKYRKYYKLGLNNVSVKNETKWYMFKFYINPFLLDLCEKTKHKIKRFFIERKSQLE